MPRMGLYIDRALSTSVPRKIVESHDAWVFPVGEVGLNETKRLYLFLENQGIQPIENLNIIVEPLDDITVDLFQNEAPTFEDTYTFEILYHVSKTATIGEHLAQITINGKGLRETLYLKFNVSSTPHRETTSEIIKRRWKCTFYEDSLGAHPITVVDFGEVWEGKPETKRVYMRNDDAGLIRGLKYTVFRNDVKVNGPDRLDKGRLAALTLTWSPGDATEFGLKDDLKIDGTLVIR